MKLHAVNPMMAAAWVLSVPALIGIYSKGISLTLSIFGALVVVTMIFLGIARSNN